LFCFGGVRVGQSFVYQSKTTIKENKRLPNTNAIKAKQQLKKTKDCPTVTRTPPKQNNN
jgi:hypothetical protein